MSKSYVVFWRDSKGGRWPSQRAGLVVPPPSVVCLGVSGSR